jgi:hypothetical protein
MGVFAVSFHAKAQKHQEHTALFGLFGLFGILGIFSAKAQKPRSRMGMIERSLDGES